MKNKPKRLQRKANDIFGPGWKEIIFRLASEGKSDTQIRAQFMLRNGMKVSSIEHAWHRLKEMEVEFAEVLRAARPLCQAWWEDKAREHLLHPRELVFEGATWMANMKNRFGWKDRTEVEHGMSDTFMEKYIAFTSDQLKARANELLGKTTTQ